MELRGLYRLVLAFVLNPPVPIVIFIAFRKLCPPLSVCGLSLGLRKKLGAVVLWRAGSPSCSYTPAPPIVAEAPMPVAIVEPSFFS